MVYNHILSAENRRASAIKIQYGSLLITEGKPRPILPYPKRVFFIIGNAFCERFNYYGVRGENGAKKKAVFFLKNVIFFRKRFFSN